MNQHALFQSLSVRLIALIASFTVIFQALSPWKAAQPDQTDFHYLAIGNSITRHPVCEYWWNESGMAASTAENDYFHLVTAYLRERFDAVTAQAVNFVEWEVSEKDRAATYAVIDPYLTDDLDLITLQLSENARYSRAFGADYADLARHIREKCPQAALILVDDFWDAAKSRSKQKAARSLGLPFAGLKAIRGDDAYMWQIGDIVYDAEGMPHAIDRADVARHPNDAGMRFIAEMIISKIKKAIK